MCKIVSMRRTASSDIHCYKRLGFRAESGVLASSYRPSKRASVREHDNEVAGSCADVVYRTPQMDGEIRLTDESVPGLCVYNSIPAKPGIIVEAFIPRGAQIYDIEQVNMPDGWATNQLIIHARQPLLVHPDHVVDDVNGDEQPAVRMLQAAGFTNIVVSRAEFDAAGRDSWGLAA